MFSYQLYSSRNFPPLSVTLSMLAEAGYAAVEGYGALYSDPEAVDAMARGLAETGLKMPTAHFGLDMLEGDPAGAVAVAKRLGIERIYCPWVHPDQRPTTAQGWRDFGARLERAGAPVRAAGLGFGWHNHDFEFVALPDGTIPMAALLEGGPALEWEMDVAWVIKGKTDPAEWIAAERGRITAAHVKDIAPAGENADEDGWADVGHGTVDWKTLLGQLRGAGVAHLVIEHDNPSDHARFARRSLAAVKGY